MGKMAISRKLYFSFGSMILLLVFISILAWTNWKKASVSQQMYADQVRATVNLANSERSLWQLRYGFPQFMVLDEQGRKKIVEEEPRWYKEINENMKAYEAGDRTPEEREAIREWNDVFHKYMQARPRWFELQGAGKTQEARNGGRRPQPRSGPGPSRRSAV
jgi:hypothetical protein